MNGEAAKMIDKAGRALSAAQILLDGGSPDFSAGRAYYAMLYSAQALLTERGLHFRKHGGVHAAFGEHFVKTGILEQKCHRWLLDAYDKRLDGDYGIETGILPDDARILIDQATDFIKAIRNALET